MATLLLLTNDMRRPAEILPALELLPHQVKGRPGRSYGAAGCACRGCDLARCPAGPGRRTLAVPAHRNNRQGGPAARHRPRGRACRRCPPTGASTTGARDCRTCRGRRTAPTRHDADGRQPMPTR